MRLGDQQKKLYNELVNRVSGRFGRDFLSSDFHFRTLHKCILGKRKWIMLTFRPRQFKHRQILKTVKGHVEGDLAWVSGRRKYFHFSSISMVGDIWIFVFLLIFFLVNFFYLKTHINDRLKKEKSCLKLI